MRLDVAGNPAWDGWNPRAGGDLLIKVPQREFGIDYRLSRPQHVDRPNQIRWPRTAGALVDPSQAPTDVAPPQANPPHAPPRYRQNFCCLDRGQLLCGCVVYNHPRRSSPHAPPQHLPFDPSSNGSTEPGGHL